MGSLVRVLLKPVHSEGRIEEELKDRKKKTNSGRGKKEELTGTACRVLAGRGPGKECLQCLSIQRESDQREQTGRREKKKKKKEKNKAYMGATNEVGERKGGGTDVDELVGVLSQIDGRGDEGPLGCFSARFLIHKKFFTSILDT